MENFVLASDPVRPSLCKIPRIPRISLDFIPPYKFSNLETLPGKIEISSIFNIHTKMMDIGLSDTLKIFPICMKV